MRAMSLPRLQLTTSRELLRLGQTSPLAQPILPVRPSILAAGGLAGFALGSHFVPKKNKALKKGLILGAILSGLAAGYLLYAGQ